MSEPRYRFGPLERRGLILGLRAGQLAVGLAGAIAALGLLLVSGQPLALPAAVLIIAGSVSAAVLPMGGRSVDEWAGPLARAALARVSGRGGWRSAAPTAGHRTLGATVTPPRADPPPALRGLELVAVDALGGHPGRSYGAVRDRDGTLTAALGVRSDGFALLDGAERTRRLAWWGSFLEGMCREGSAIRRLQWVERAVPDGGAGACRHLDESGAAGASPRAIRSYRELLAQAAPATQRHETLLVAQIAGAAGSGRATRRGAGRRGEDSAARLTREVSAIGHRLTAGDLAVDGVLTPELLSRWLAIAFDPWSSPPAPAEPAGGPFPHAWPLGVESSWSRLRVDGAVHATYWVREWPRTDVGPDFLAPLLLQTAAARTVSMTMAFDPPSRAQREAEAAMTADLADEELRRRAGFLVGFRRRREQENVVRRGEEIAAGHGSVRFSAYVTVSAPSDEALDAACTDVEQQAQQSRLQLQRLAGMQDLGFSFTLPLARGLR